MLLVDDASKTIMDCLHSIPQKETATRVVLPGRHYSLPPTRGRHGSAIGLFGGASTIRPAIVTKNNGKRELRVCTVSEKDETFGTMNEAADVFYGPVIAGLILDDLRRACMAPIKRRVASLTRRMEKIAQDKQRLERFASGQEVGELLKANLNRVTKGMTNLDVVEWTGQRKVSIELDPALDAVANMQRIFAKASKGKRGQALVEKRLEDTIAEKGALDDLLLLLQQAETLEEVSAVIDRTSFSQEKALASRGEKRRYVPNNRGRSFAEFRRYVSDSGLAILVGKTGQGNDSILRKKARQGDLWFHAKDAPGAHVVMQVSSGLGATTLDIEKAAALAGYFSALRTAGKGEIMMADVKNVRPISGGPPGKVMVRKYETLMANWPARW